MNESYQLIAELIFFDAVLFSVYRRIGRARANGDRRSFYPFTVTLIGFLINAAPFACGTHMAIAPITVGGFALFVLSGSERAGAFVGMTPNQSTDPTPASGTPPAGQESRHP
jgi:hypothetical protein